MRSRSAVAGGRRKPSMRKLSRVILATVLAEFVISDDANLNLVFASQSCAQDLTKLSKRRESALKVMNEIVKAYEGQPLPPGLFCPKFADLVAAEQPLLDYMVGNKDTCKIPQPAIDQLTTTVNKTLQFGQRYCS
jgi:hypothetical protein